MPQAFAPDPPVPPPAVEEPPHERPADATNDNNSVTLNQGPRFISQELVIVSTPNGLERTIAEMSDGLDSKHWCQTTAPVVINSERGVDHSTERHVRIPIDRA